jgi:hypothetical protein
MAEEIIRRAEVEASGVALQSLLSAAKRLADINYMELHDEGYRSLNELVRVVRAIEHSLTSGDEVHSQADLRYFSTVPDVTYIMPDGFPGPHPLTQTCSLQRVRALATALVRPDAPTLDRSSHREGHLGQVEPTPAKRLESK